MRSRIRSRRQKHPATPPRIIRPVEVAVMRSVPSNLPNAKRPTLRGNVSWALFGNAVNSGSQWLSLLLLARLSNPETVGMLALAKALVAPVYTFLNLQLRGIQATDAAHRFSFPTIWTVRLATCIIALTICLGYAAFRGQGTFALVLGFVAATRALESLSDAVHGRLQRSERLDWIAKSMAIRGPLTVFVFLGVFWATDSLSLATLALALATGATLIVYDLPALRRILLREQDADRIRGFFPSLAVRTAEVVPLLRSALPLGVVLLLISLSGNVPRYVLESSVGLAELGIFAALTQLISAGAVVVSAAANAASPRLAKYYNAHEPEKFFRLLRRLYGVVAAIGIAGALLSVLGGAYILQFLAGPSFAAHAGLLVPLTIGGCLTFAGSVTGVGLTAAGAHFAQLPLAVLVLLVAVCASWLLIPSLELHGAALAIIITYGIKLLAGTYVLRRGFRPGR